MTANCSTVRLALDKHDLVSIGSHRFVFAGFNWLLASFNRRRLRRLTNIFSLCTVVRWVLGVGNLAGLKKVCILTFELN